MEVRCEEIAVRVRPMLETETGKREMIVHTEVLPTQRDLVMVSDAEKFFQISADLVFSASTPQYRISESYESLLFQVLEGRSQVLLVVGFQGSGKSYSVFGPETHFEPGGEARDVKDLGLLAGILTCFFQIEPSPGKLLISAFGVSQGTDIADLIPKSEETAEETGPSRMEINSVVQGLATFSQIYQSRKYLFEEAADSPPPDTVLLLEIEPGGQSPPLRIAICMTEAADAESQFSWEQYATSAASAPNETIPVTFLRESMGSHVRLVCLATVSPVMYPSHSEFASESILTLQFASRLRTGKRPKPPSKPPTRPRSRSTQRPSRNASFSAVSQLTESSFMHMVLQGDSDISTVMESLRKTELSTAAEELSRALPGLGRCPVCTLRLPCCHYADISELPKTVHRQSETSSVSHTPLKGKGTAGRQSCSSQLSEVSQMTATAAESKERTVRVRDKGGNYIVNRVAVPTAGKPVPTAESRLAVVEKLEAYREERLRKELKHLEERKEQERIERELAQRKEAMRQKYLLQQKQKLKEYHEKQEKAPSKIPRLPKAKAAKPRSKTSDTISFYDHKRDYILHVLKFQEMDLDRMRFGLGTKTMEKRRTHDAVDFITNGDL